MPCIIMFLQRDAPHGTRRRSSMVRPSEGVVNDCKALNIDGSRNHIGVGPTDICAIAGLALVSDFVCMRHGADLTLFEQRLLR